MVFNGFQWIASELCVGPGVVSKTSCLSTFENGKLHVYDKMLSFDANAFMGRSSQKNNGNTISSGILSCIC